MIGRHWEQGTEWVRTQLQQALPNSLWMVDKAKVSAKDEHASQGKIL